MIKQYRTLFLKSFTIVSMVFCVVFTPIIKVTLNLFDTLEKTSQIIDEEPCEKEAQYQMDFYNQQANSNSKLEQTYPLSSKGIVFLSFLIKTKPYLKTPTPPPDNHLS